ncbi:MAG: hypothetical protein ACKOC8_05970, partial [Pirellulales bacterium]
VAALAATRQGTARLGTARLGMGFVSPGDCLSGATFPIPEFFAMRKSKFASDAIDEAIAPLFPRDSDDAIRELVEKSVARVVGQDPADLGIDLDEIADAVVIDEFNKLSPEQQNAVNESVAEELTDRLKDMFREHVRSILRG